MKKKYTVWGILMIVLGAIGAAFGLFVSACFAICMTESGFLSYERTMMQMDMAISKDELQLMLVIYFVLICLFTILQTFVQIHGGIKLIKKQAKGKGWFIAYGIESILAAIGYAVFAFSSCFSIIMIQSMPGASVGVAAVIVCMIVFFSLATIYKIVTACMMFSKMGSLTIAGKTSAVQTSSYESTQNQPILPETVLEGQIMILNGEYENHSFQVKDGQEIAIGSDATKSNLTLHDEKVSEKHCIVSYHGETDMFHLTDVSETGTIVNGVPIDSNITYALPKGSIVMLGNSIQFQTK